MSQHAVVGGTDAGDRGLDVGVRLSRGIRERLAVVNGLKAVVDGDEIEEQAGDASVEFVKRVQRDKFALVVRQPFGELLV